MDRYEAIAAIEECRDIHQTWIDNNCYKDQHGEAAAYYAGDSSWHQNWIDKYNGVLGVLESIR